MLGLPYQATFVRPLEGWKVDARLIDETLDASDPARVAPVVPPGPLVPYRDFLVEYPPGFFLFAIPPALVARGIDSYAAVFSLSMAALLTAALALLWDTANRLAASHPRAKANAAQASDDRARFVLFATTCALAFGPVVLRRYDAVVSFSLCLLVWGCVSRRAWASGVGLGLGVAAKGMPLLLGPILLLYFWAERRGRDAFWTGVIAAAIGVAAILPFASSAGGRMLDMFVYHGQRPLQIESSAGAILVVGRFFDPAFAGAAQTYGSMNVVGAWDPPLRVLASILPLVALALVSALAWRALRGASSDSARARVLVSASCAALAFFMVLGKVFSPQYLTWLLPLGMLASLPGAGAPDRGGKARLAPRRTLLGALVLTQVIWPLLLLHRPAERP